MPKIGQIRPLIRSVCVLIDRSLFIHYYYYYYSNPHTICYHHFLTTYYNVSTFYYYTYLLQYYKKKSRGVEHFYPTFFPIILNVKGWMVTQMFQLCSVHSAAVACPQWWNLKVSKSRKQILKFSFEPKNERKYLCISALASKRGQI